ncbi:MAG: PEP-CTERM sorting domain-containing protein, partial [Opitutae bacterium]|nr:PEP-CTERM sorting domain-containing protein [Opitutae bacterium]
ADPATTPGIVPEPGTLGLLLIGAPLLLAARRRRVRTNGQRPAGRRQTD